MEKVLKTEKLSVGYKKNIIVDDINISIEKGKIICLAGSNGSGKSTLLRTLAGIQKPLGGMIFVGDKDITAYSELEKASKISLLLTDRVEPELMTGYDIVASGRYPYTGRLGILADNDREIINDVMELIGITEIGNRYFSEMSDGQKQRFMLARALCQEPDILIMDEPMTFLDIKYKKELADIIVKLKKEKNLTMIMSLHELELIRSLADTVICIKAGAVDKVGKPDEILNDEYIDYLFDII
ncbi:MAG: ABC transporter ATP-binding protein [Eubacterium sp.]|nr:ABC transporter ATP-binding protein [Eubacterium sp.]